MIFVTVGTQLAFPRLIDVMERYAQTSGEEVIAQVGEETTPRDGIDVRHLIAPAAYNEIFRRARVIVAHAGIGTILSARKFGRPLVIVPRRCDLGEHRNDHQTATARALEDTPGLHVAWEAEDVPALLASGKADFGTNQASPRRGTLISGLAAFIAEGKRPQERRSPGDAMTALAGGHGSGTGGEAPLQPKK